MTRLAQAREALARATTKTQHLGQAERTIVVAGDLAYVHQPDPHLPPYRVELEDGVPVLCSCNDPRATRGACKHADAVYEVAKDGDGTYVGTLTPKPRNQGARP